MKFVGQLLEGMAYLHSNGIIHCDIKPQNILISSTMTLKIADFGISRVFVSSRYDKPLRNAQVFSPLYRDINILRANVNDISVPYSFETDIWAAAITILEMETGIHPLTAYFVVRNRPGFSDSQIAQIILNGIELIFSRGNTGDPTPALRYIRDNVPILHMCVQMLDFNGGRRITAKQALALLDEL